MRRRTISGDGNESHWLAPGNANLPIGVVGVQKTANREIGVPRDNGNDGNGVTSSSERIC